MGLEKEFKKYWFVDVVNAECHLRFDQVAVYSLKDREATDIEGLMKVR